jgi:hypothetical protein
MTLRLVRWGSRLGSTLFLGALAFGALHCGGSGVPGSDDWGGVDIEVDESEIKGVLRGLFPDLTDAELDEIATGLDLEAVLELKAEIVGIRSISEALSRALSELAEAAIEKRNDELVDHNGGFPVSVEPVGRIAYYDSAQGEGCIELSGVFSDRSAVSLASGDVTISVDGAVQAHELDCLHLGQSVDVVFLVDITGSMSPVIHSVRRSLQTFVDAIVAANVTGTIGVVTFQDTVGVDVTFQEPAPAGGFERSPFFEPVRIDDASGVDGLTRFITRLEANSGADAPENLAAALDFAQNNVIGTTKTGSPNLVGDGTDDPPGVAPWPKLTSERQVFVVFTDAPFHSDSRNSDNSSLLPEFEPRPIDDILASLQANGTTVHVSDPSFGDDTLTPSGASSEVSVDSDFWAKHTGGLGEDHVAGYSLVDLDLVVVAEDSGLLDIVLDGIVSSTCSVRFPLPSFQGGVTFDLRIERSGESFSEALTPVER